VVICSAYVWPKPYERFAKVWPTKCVSAGTVSATTNMITRLWFYYSIYDYIHRRACKLHSLETPTRMKIQRKLHSYSAQARLTCTRALTRAHTCTDTCIHTRTRAHAQATWRPWWLPAKALPKTTITHTFTLTHTHTCSHTHIHTHAQTHTQAHTHTHTNTYTRTGHMASMVATSKGSPKHSRASSRVPTIPKVGISFGDDLWPMVIIDCDD